MARAGELPIGKDLLHQVLALLRVGVVNALGVLAPDRETEFLPHEMRGWVGHAGQVGDRGVEAEGDLERLGEVGV